MNLHLYRRTFTLSGATKAQCAVAVNATTAGPPKATQGSAHFLGVRRLAAACCKARLLRRCRHRRQLPVAPCLASPKLTAAKHQRYPPKTPQSAKHSNEARSIWSAAARRRFSPAKHASRRRGAMHPRRTSANTKRSSFATKSAAPKRLRESPHRAIHPENRQSRFEGRTLC